MLGSSDLDPNGPRTLGKYQLLRLLARGGMGEVYLARLPGELGFEKRLVVKTIRAELAADPRFIELFATEAKTAVALSHPNIAPIYELGRAEDGTLYTAMGWVDGPSLFTLAERLRAVGRTLELGCALFITREILDGLAHAHSRDRERPPVVHRDITPRNVLVDRNGRVQIVDFGIAKPADAEVVGAMGSAGYMAPEQARGEPVDPRADVFSVGCVLYELLTNRRAFADEGVWILPSFAELPAPLRPVLERALALDPRRRFANAEGFLRELAPSLAEHAPALGTRGLATMLAELFEDGWELDGAELGGARTPATQVTGAVEAFATRIGVQPLIAEVDGLIDVADTHDRETRRDSAVLIAAEPRRARSLAWPLAGLLAMSAGFVGYRLARSEAPPRAMVEQTPPSPPSAPEPATTKQPSTPDLRRAPASIPVPPQLAQPTPLVLEISPADASVELEGEPLAGPPYAFSPTGNQPIELSITHPDFRSRSVVVDPRAAPVSPLRIELEALESGSLTVLAPSVAWAEVWLDGARFGTTPLTDKPVREGKHRLEIRCTAAVCGGPQILLDRSIRVRPGRSLEIGTEDDRG